MVWTTEQINEEFRNWFNNIDNNDETYNILLDMWLESENIRYDKDTDYYIDTMYK